MPKFDVYMMVEADDAASAILGFLYPDGEPTSMKVDSISVSQVERNNF